MIRPPLPPPATPMRSGPSTAGKALAIAAVVLIAIVALLLWPTFKALNGAIVSAIEDWRGLVGAGFLLFIGALFVGLLALLFAAGAKAWHKAQQAAVVKLPNGMPAHIADVRAARRSWRSNQDGLVAQLLAPTMADHGAQLLAEKQREMPNVTSYHQTVTHAPPAQLGAAENAAPIALSTEAEWLGWTDQAPHLMVAGRTESGKTTTVEAILARRILADDFVLVIDPHYQKGKWLGARAVGGGRDYATCYQTFDAVRTLLDRRYKAFDAGMRTEDFKRVTIVVDEVPAIIAHASQNKAMVERWLLFATSLGSEARKVRISVILLTQSPLVRDIGISSAMRENFTRIALGDTAADLLREEPNATHKQALLELLRGRPYPAAMEYRNNWYALRNDDIPNLARTNGTAPRVPTSLIAPAQRAITSSLPPPAPNPAASNPPAPIPPTLRVITVPEQILDLLTARDGQWMTASEIAAALRLDRQVAGTEVSALTSAGQLVSRKCIGRRTKERLEYTINASTHQRINALSA